MDRRNLLRNALALAAGGLSLGACADTPTNAETRQPGATHAFDFAALKKMAQARAAETYHARFPLAPRALRTLGWDEYQSIRFRPKHALWHAAGLKFRISFFHLGRQFTHPVRMYTLDHGQANEIEFDPSMFDYSHSGLDPSILPHDLGFAGFRIQFDGDWKRDVAAFLGASYFRAVGASMQYGLSARGLAIDTGMSRPEEFPTFTAYWFEKPAPGSRSLRVYALLDSPSVTGAYRFDISPGDETRMAMELTLYVRKPIERIGIAPGTSMYWCGENQKLACDDWRPEIHDSDGLSMHSGVGEWIWRPLNDPKHLTINSYVDRDPKGFGLMQRDHDFDHYQDDGVWYNRRPGLWTKTHGNWGKGAVQLVEIPTNDETSDNIVAYWNPAKPVRAGDQLSYAYTLYWGATPPARTPLAEVVATRIGAGGVVGQKHTHYSRRFVVDFKGGVLGKTTRGANVEAVVSLSSGKTELVSARPLAPIHGWRAMFDVVPDKTTAAIDMRLYLRENGRPLTETWLYQWMPPPVADRKF